MIALVVALALADLQPAARQTQSVVIDATVSDARGRAVETLKPQDFEIRENGALVTLDEARFVRNSPRAIALYLDEYHVPAGADTDRVRELLTDFIDHDLAPTDRVVVMKPLDSLLKIDITTDHAAARAIVASFQGREGDYEPRNDYEREFIAGAPPRVEAARAQVVWSALNALAVHLGSAGAERKLMFVVTESLVRPGRHRGLILPSVDAVIRTADRANVSVYYVDPSVDPPTTDADDSLQRVASETNGRAIRGDIATGLRRAFADANGYYLLTYRASNPPDGKFHPVQVTVKRSGSQVRARTGYFAPSPDDALRAAVLEKLNAPKVDVPPEPPPHASTLIQPWFGWSRAADGKTRVTFVWEPATRVPGDRNKKIPTKLTFTALTLDGTVLFEGAVAPTGAGAIDEPGVVPSRAVFDATPGRVKLRMTIQDAAAQVLDRDVREIVVRDLKGDVAIGTAQIMRARTARELRTLDEEAAVPVVSRDFSRTEQLLVRIPIYAASAGAPMMSARLKSRMGQTMRDLRLAPTNDGFEACAVPLAGLAIGEYVIEVTASNGPTEARDRINFRVTP
ncbi:MAG TPA: VWA domain-containing protein [Vicinamibacterales bacterium]|nr:VWA domain-containing protein [Vicinamibacterales bacterium]